MTPIDFHGSNVVIAKDDPQYQPIPAHVDCLSQEFATTFCWRLTWRERWQLLITGKLWQQVLTFGGPLQPQLLHVDKPVLATDGK